VASSFSLIASPRAIVDNRRLEWAKTRHFARPRSRAIIEREKRKNTARTDNSRWLLGANLLRAIVRQRGEIAIPIASDRIPAFPNSRFPGRIGENRRESIGEPQQVIYKS